MRFLYSVLLLLVATNIAQAASAAAPAATSAPSRVAKVTPPTQEEALAFVKVYSPSALRREAEVGMLRRSFVEGLRREPAIAEMLDTFPKLGEALTKAMESQVDLYISEYDERFFPRATQIVVKSISRDDVLALTAFYRSPLGRKMLISAASKVDGSEVIDRALAGKDIDAGVAKRQALRAGMATFAALSPEERREIGAMAQSPTGRQFQAMMPDMIALQVELTNKPGPKFSAGAEAAMAAAFKRETEGGVDAKSKE